MLRLRRKFCLAAEADIARHENMSCEIIVLAKRPHRSRFIRLNFTLLPSA
jgi:hypothetical protein